MSSFLGRSLALTSSCGGAADEPSPSAPTADDLLALTIEASGNPDTSVEFVTSDRGEYLIDRLKLSKLVTARRSAPMLVDVAAATGLAHT